MAHGSFLGIDYRTGWTEKNICKKQTEKKRQADMERENIKNCPIIMSLIQLGYSAEKMQGAFEVFKVLTKGRKK